MPKRKVRTSYTLLLPRACVPLLDDLRGRLVADRAKRGVYDTTPPSNSAIVEQALGELRERLTRDQGGAT